MSWVRSLVRFLAPAKWQPQNDASTSPVQSALPSYDQVVRHFTAAGSPLEIRTETIEGAQMRVFVQRPHRLGDLLPAVEAFGDRECIVQGDTRLSCAEFAARVRECAGALRNRLGLSKGDRVGILAANRIEWMIAMWATLYAGGVVVALNGWWTKTEIEDAISRAHCGLLIADARRLSRLGTCDNVRIISMDEDTPNAEMTFADLVRDASPAPPAKVEEDDPAAIMFTSGTTGNPNGVRITHRAWIAGLMNSKAASAISVATQPELGPGDTDVRVLASLPFFHVGGGHGVVLGALAAGATVVIPPEKFDPATTLDLMETERITRWSAVPAMVRAVCFAAGEKPVDLSTVRTVGYGAAPSGEDLQRLVERTFPNLLAISNAYGLTEAGSVFAMNTGADLLSHPDSVGRPFLTAEIRIVDNDEIPLAVGDVGEVQVRGPFLMSGYLGGDDTTLFAAGRWLRTGDIGRMDQDNFLYLLDRKKDIIIRGGENIFAGEVERRIEAHPSVVEAAVVAHPSERFGEEVRAVVRLLNDQRLEPEALQAWVRETLAAFKAPSIVEYISEPLPRNAAGKLIKSEIRERTLA